MGLEVSILKTCKDCVHSDVCHIVEMSSWWELTDYRCDDFKDKSKFIELPCSIGDYCIWEDNLWYVTGVHYFNDRNGDFLLWMSMADKSPCGTEAIASQVKFVSEEEAKKILEELK